MLQRRMGMICTSSGCGSCSRPRTNSLTDRALRLSVGRKANPKIIASGCRRLDRTHPLYAAADLQRPAEDAAHRNEAEQLVARDGRQTGGGNASAVAAVGRPAELAWRDLRLQIRGNRRGGQGEHALVR